jgi:TatD DNase family protein
MESNNTARHLGGPFFLSSQRESEYKNLDRIELVHINSRRRSGRLNKLPALRKDKKMKNPEEKKISLVDSHAHLNMPDFDSDRDQVLERSFQNGITAVLCPIEVSDQKNLETSLRMIGQYDRVHAVAGVHPHAASKFNPQHETAIRNLAANGSICAVGEIGLDFHYHFSPEKEQIEVFRRQLALAGELALPAVIHSRSAADKILSAIREEQITRAGVLHCFTENLSFAKQMLELGFFISFSGILTFPGAYELRETAKQIPLDRLLVETDSPYLTPVPFRGKIKRNEPYYIIETARILAELKGLTLEELAGVTSENFTCCFGIEICD